MLRKESEPLRKITVDVYASDIELLRDLYPTIGLAKTIRVLIRNHLRVLEGKIQLEIR
jgi:hypothetical protein